MIEFNLLPDLTSYLKEWEVDLDNLRQNRLLDSHDLTSFVNNRGIVTGDVSVFHKHGWLPNEKKDRDGILMFHPFRIYPISMIQRDCDLNITSSSSLDHARYKIFVDKVLVSMPTADAIGERAIAHNRIVDLAILLEPLYWMRMTRSQFISRKMATEEYNKSLESYRTKVFKLIIDLDLKLWQKAHMELCFDAYLIDKNRELYLLLRTSLWDKREKIEGEIGGALWLRHIGEVIRRGFEEVFQIKWAEEDQFVERWYADGRKWAYGSERPLDDESKSSKYFAWNYGLITGSVVRWYVEGETEYFAIKEIIKEPSREYIELVNLRGNIAQEKRNVALKLSDLLTEDKALNRFSFISFDYDVPANVKAIKRQVDQHNVIGYITANKPDFEFANYTIKELVEIAAKMDESNGCSGDSVRYADWSTIKSSKIFEQHYKQVSKQIPRGLKGERWGKALAEYAMEHPINPTTGDERPFCKEIQAALTARTANYYYHLETFDFEPETFKLKRKEGPNLLQEAFQE